MTPRRRLLFLSPIIPAQRGNGLAMRTCFFLEAYARHFEIDLAVLPIIAAPEKITDFVRACVARLHVFPRPPTDAHFSFVAATLDPTARLSAFVRYGHPSLASRAGAFAQQMLENWVKNDRYDVVHVERLYLAPLVARWTSVHLEQTRLVIDCDDDDAAAYRQLAAIERRLGRTEPAAWAEAEAAAFNAMAHKMLRCFHLAFAASAIAAESLSVHGTQVTVVPNVVPIGRTPLPRRIKIGCKVILFVGTMGYAPNDDAARWFLTRIWPRVCRLFRTPVRLVIVGTDPSPRLLRLAQRPDVVVTGTVAETAPFYRIADLAVIPVRAGSGSRIKLLEAAAHGVPVVSTTAGAEGTTFRHEHELLLADTEERFARACADLLQDRPRASRLARQARARIILDYDAGRWNRRIGDLVARVFVN